MKPCITIYRHLRLRFLSCSSVSLEVLVASVLFGIALLLNNPIQIVINLLYFIIVLEVTRMIVEYIRSPKHRVKIRYLVDAAIIATLREIIILIVDSHHILDHIANLILYSSGVVFLMLVRYLSMKVSPDEME